MINVLYSFLQLAFKHDLGGLTAQGLSQCQLSVMLYTASSTPQSLTDIQFLNGPVCNPHFSIVCCV